MTVVYNNVTNALFKHTLMESDLPQLYPAPEVNFGKSIAADTLSGYGTVY